MSSEPPAPRFMPVPRVVVEALAFQYGPDSTAARALQESGERAEFYLDSYTGELIVTEPEVAEA